MLIILDKVNYVYSEGSGFEKKALDDVSLTIDKGEFIGLIGHTGSGKSTLTQHLNGLLRATSGNIYYDGQDIYEKGFVMKNLRSKVGLVFQYPEHQMVKDTVYEDVIFGPRNLNLDKEQCEKRAKASLSMVGIPEEMWDKSPLQLSGGQKRRVAIAGVLAMKPDFIILDEPAAGLGPEETEFTAELVTSLNKQGLSILFIEHDMNFVRKIADQVTVLYYGKKFAEGAIEDIVNDERVIQIYLGNS